MSCWVVPAVAAEYWGVSLDVVWSRVYNQLVPHKSESGFVFVDVDPWHPAPNLPPIEPPPTFESAAADTVATFAHAAEQPEPFEFLTTFELAELGSSSSRSACSDASDPPAWDDESGPSPDDEPSESDDLPALDEEESATFGRLSWEDVRRQVSRTRRPPAARAS